MPLTNQCIMEKTLLYRLFKLGKIPTAFSEQIQKEGIILHDEGIRSSLTFRNFHAPGKRCAWKRLWSDSSIALTPKMLFVFMRSRQIIGVAWSDPKIKQLNFSLKDDNTLSVKFDAAMFQPSWSGELEVRLCTPLAQAFLNTIKQKTERHIQSDLSNDYSKYVRSLLLQNFSA